MDEQHSLEKEERRSLEDRLTFYYGPALREQPLAVSSWQRLRSQLGPQRPPVRGFGRRRRVRRKGRYSATPAFIQDAFAHIMREARLPYAPSMLSCSSSFHVRAPGVRVFPLGGHSIRLTLPIAAALSLEPPELDVLLATGLARYLSMRKPGYVTMRLLLSSVIPLVWIILLLLWQHNLPLLVLPIAILLCLPLCGGAFWLLHVQRRRMALRADTLMVQWLGRGRACQGLHALAGRTRTASRRRWGEPSLAERIGRVCGTEVNIEHERLTLVR